MLVRHGETAWTISGQHTSHTDVALTARGEEQARRLADVLRHRSFALVLTSPLRRAADTARLAGFGDATADDDLREWDYGDFEGRTTSEIRRDQPEWTLWRDGVPGGETASQVAERADRVLTRARAAGGDVLVFSHGHLLRVLAARWLGLDADAGRFFALSPGTISLLGWEREQAVISGWNEAPSLPPPGAPQSP